jgi:hypothetical protein
MISCGNSRERSKDMSLFGFIGDIASKIGDLAKVVAPIAALIPGAQGIAVAAAAVSQIAPAVEKAADSLDDGQFNAADVTAVTTAVAGINGDAGIYLRNDDKTPVQPA